MAKVKFYRGSAANYSSTTHTNGIYFNNTVGDYGYIISDGRTYGKVIEGTGITISHPSDSDTDSSGAFQIHSNLTSGTGTSSHIVAYDGNATANSQKLKDSGFTISNNTFDATSTTIVPTSKAISDYVSTFSSSAMHYKGSIAGAATSAGSTALPSSCVIGDVYTVSTAGYIGGVYYEANDNLIAKATKATQTATADWTVVQADGTYAAKDHTHNIKLNNVAQDLTTTFYAPIDPGETTQVLIGGGSKPTWKNMNLLNVDHATNADNSSTAHQLYSGSTLYTTTANTLIAFSAGVASDATWTVGSTSTPVYLSSGKLTAITNNVVYTGTVTSGNIAIFDGTAGAIKDSTFSFTNNAGLFGTFGDKDTSVPSELRIKTYVDSAVSSAGLSSGVGINISNKVVNVKLNSTTKPASDVSTTYPVSLNAVGNLAVIVPWVDTKYTNGTTTSTTSTADNDDQMIVNSTLSLNVLEFKIDQTKANVDKARITDYVATPTSALTPAIDVTLAATDSIVNALRKHEDELTWIDVTA